MNHNYTPETRQRMRPWLESRINSGSIKGLEWIHREKKIFKVPWKHVGNREWSEDDGIIFKEWAVHTGRFREGVDQPDWPTWKTRFRCALTKLPDIKELKDCNKLDGQTEEPYRVYQFVPRNGGESTRIMSPVSDLSRYSDEESRSPVHHPMIPSTVPDHSSLDNHMSIGEKLPSDIKDINLEGMSFDSDLISKIPQGDIDEKISIEMREQDSIPLKAEKPYPFEISRENPNHFEMNLNDCKLFITVKYTLITILEHLCTVVGGCRIFFDKQVQLNSQTEYEQMYGPSDAEPLRLPVCKIQNTHQQRLTMDLLNAMDRGIVLRVVNGNIYATRKCRCRIYIACPSLTSGCEVIKLPRDQEILVYDVQNYFQPALERYLYQRGPKPLVDIIIGFGQHFTMERQSISSLLVSATVAHTEAHTLLTRINCSSPMSPGISLSKSDTLDRLMDVLQYTHIQTVNNTHTQCL